MRIKNISGRKQYFAAGKRGVELEADAIGTVEDSPEAWADVARHLANKVIEVVDASPISSNLQPVDLPVAKDIIMNTVVDTNTVVIEGVTFEFNSTGGVTAGRTEVVLPTADDAGRATAAANLKAAINADATLAALKIFAKDVYKSAASTYHLIVAREDGDFETAITMSAGAGTVTFAAITGLDNHTRGVSIVRKTAAAGLNIFYTGLKTVEEVIVQVQASTGALKAYDGLITKSGSLVVLDDSGDADLGNTDIITIIATGVR